MKNKIRQNNQLFLMNQQQRLNKLKAIGSKSTFPRDSRSRSSSVEINESLAANSSNANLGKKFADRLQNKY